MNKHDKEYAALGFLIVTLLFITFLALVVVPFSLGVQGSPLCPKSNYTGCLGPTGQGGASLPYIYSGFFFGFLLGSASK